MVSEQAARLKRIRCYLGFTREEFAQLVKLSPFTLRSWENGQKRLGKKAIHKLVTQLAHIDFHCSFEWLMQGQGLSPISLREAATQSLSSAQTINEPKPLPEIYALKTLYPEINIIKVSDDSYQPVAEQGDYLGIRILAQERWPEQVNRLLIYQHRSGVQGIGQLRADDRVISLDQRSVFPVTELHSLNELLWFRKA